MNAAARFKKLIHNCLAGSCHPDDVLNANKVNMHRGGMQSSLTDCMAWERGGYAEIRPAALSCVTNTCLLLLPPSSHHCARLQAQHNWGMIWARNTSRMKEILESGCLNAKTKRHVSSKRMLEKCCKDAQ